MLKVTCLSAFTDNYLWLVHSPSAPGCVAAVDPGDGQVVLEALQKYQLNLQAILVTHHHHDHVGGINTLLEHHRVPVYGPENEPIPGRTHHATALTHLDLAPHGLPDLAFQVFDTPGHTRGHISYYGHEALFCGDTLFNGGCGRVFDGTATELYASLQLLKSLPDHTQVFCAHEYTLKNLEFALSVQPRHQPTLNFYQSMRQLRETNQATVPFALGSNHDANIFFRAHEPELILAVKHITGRLLGDPLEVFIELRQLKNNF